MRSLVYLRTPEFHSKERLKDFSIILCPFLFDLDTYDTYYYYLSFNFINSGSRQHSKPFQARQYNSPTRTPNYHLHFIMHKIG